MRPDVLVRLQRFVEHGGVVPSPDDGGSASEAHRLLMAILGSGSFLPELLLADIDALPALLADPWLRSPKPPEEIVAAVEAETAPAADFADFKRRLRVVRRREMLRLGARELGWGTTAEVARELSFFADACLQAAWRFCDTELRREYGAPTSQEGDGPPPQFVVIAMGKLGGQELNFSSDVDICYFYSTDAGEAGRVSLHGFYSELSRRITSAIEEQTGDGTVFRVDLRLRPEGRNGPICYSLPATERYYETFGRTWERQALLRARSCAGDLGFGAELLAALDPFVYPRHIEPKMVEDIRALRTMFRAQGDAHGGAGAGGFDVKLGTGGIRDVELVVQTLQLLHGGKRRDLRDRSTMRGLHRLLMAGLVTDREAQMLAEAYRFWRVLEHRVQIENGAQTHRLPADDDSRAWLATGLRYSDLAAFDAAVTRHRTAVEAIAATFDDPTPRPGQAVLRLLDPTQSQEDVEAALAALGFRDLEAAVATVDLARGRVPIAFIEQSVASPDPDRALRHLREVALRGSVGLMALLRDHPQLLRMLATLFGTSDRLSDLLIRHPERWEFVVENLGARVRTLDELRAAVRERLPPAAGESDDGEETLRALRRFQAEELLRIGLQDVSGNLTPAEVSEQLSALAEVCLAEAVAVVLPPLHARYGHPNAALTILGMGSLGAREMRYGSDLDLVFLYSEDGESTTGVDHREWYARASQRLIGAMQALLEEGRLYDVDTRLRPSGEQGMLVTSYRAFERYHLREAAGWERVALLRARVVYTTLSPGVPPEVPSREIESLLARITYDRPIDEEKFRTDLRAVRQRVERERGKVPPGSRHLRFDPGGLMDVEFLVALGQLRLGADPGLRTTSTLAALARLVALGWPATLGEDYAFLRLVALRLRLLRDRPEEVIGPADLTPLARTLERDAQSLAAELDRRMARVRAAFTATF
ncbi:MAG TPA: bifunctional [glutamate--ammonia ligase]-adenylyl-L-tyrosine phosphorylase/[glutamate--ammonia-ligase] adenylyltransferase [Polyangia bacterium]|nr:bifunctional [glutamate--ammonia ligase]-adenylyl-L-tyrosine phosphorylase/[glutamate--ammonia-ligase] adenylyltransferase [Polyangia bacterium]